MYDNYKPFRNWLRKVGDINLVKSMGENQKKKNRTGNTFVVLGANGYLGWASICQLVYKFGGCRIIAVDKDFNSKESIIIHKPIKMRVETLKTFFDFSITLEKADVSDYKVCKNIIVKYKPDYIINLIDGNNKKNEVLKNFLDLTTTHLIVSTGYKNRRELKCRGKVTEFKTSNVIGLCNLVTLIHPDLSTFARPTSFLNKMIQDAGENKIVRNPTGYISVLSLEDFTRAFVKIIRKGQVEKYKSYYAVEKNISLDRVLNIIKSTYLYFGIDVKNKPSNKYYNKTEIKEKREFLKLIDKHRPPVDNLISYSCKNYLDLRG